MWHIVNILLFLAIFKITIQAQNNCENIFIITIDGYRWQELFNGADSTLIRNCNFVKDTAVASSLYWDEDMQTRRKLLMPFVWQYISKYGQIWGNRTYENYVQVSNPFKISYAGYNELLNGYVDPMAYSNAKRLSSKNSILNYFATLKSCKNKIALFGSWNLFAFIQNNEDNELYMNCGFQTLQDLNLNATEKMSNYVLSNMCKEGLATRSDMLTFTMATEYIKKNHPKIVYIGFGEADEFAHQGRYDEYLNQGNLFDRLLSNLWSTVQSDPVYKNKTTFFITTDHGRGMTNRWTSHGVFTKGSGQTWLIQLGPNIKPLGEMKHPTNIYTINFAQTIAHYLGEKYIANHEVAQASAELLLNTYK